MSEGGPGTIVELNPHDALGWIELDAGGRVRFGGSAMKGFRALPTPGTRVEVRGTAPGFAGAIKAVLVVPLQSAEEKAAVLAAAPQPIAWSELVKLPFGDALATAAPCARPAAPLSLAPHPLFDPWRAEIEGAPTVVDLHVPSYRAREPVDASIDGSFALGRTAYLETPTWPSCGICGRGLRMGIQIAPSVMADFVPGGRGLVAMFCFACGTSAPADPRVGFVRLITPRHRVEGPDVFASDAERSLESATQRVRAGAPRSAVTGALWYRHRSERVRGTASSLLFGYDARPITGAPAEVDPADLDDLGAVFDDWIAESAPRASWGGACLGGTASWDQADATPRCAHGERLLLLDYEGGQFLDGSLHVFACRAHACELAFVAEF